MFLDLLVPRRAPSVCVSETGNVSGSGPCPRAPSRDVFVPDSSISMCVTLGVHGTPELETLGRSILFRPSLPPPRSKTLFLDPPKCTLRFGRSENPGPILSDRGFDFLRPSSYGRLPDNELGRFSNEPGNRESSSKYCRDILEVVPVFWNFTTGRPGTTGVRPGRRRSLDP